MLTGCDKKVEMVRANSAEEVLNLFNTYNSENNVEEMVKLYSNAYINYIGYDANQIIKNIKANRKDVIINLSTTSGPSESAVTFLFPSPTTSSLLFFDIHGRINASICPEIISITLSL